VPELGRDRGGTDAGVFVFSDGGLDASTVVCRYDGDVVTYP
jgi:hypothetical protein